MQAKAGALANCLVAALPDRGGDGALIIYYYCLPELIRKLRREYGGDTSTETVTIRQTDTWPEPARRE